MRMLTLIATLILAAAQGAPPNPPGDPKDNGIIEGFVRAPGTGEPIAEVSVVVTGPNEYAGPLARSSAIRTDAKGHFIATDIRPGRYAVVAWREGYYWPGVDANKERTIVTLAPRQHIDNVVLELVPLAIISGRVLGTDGEPLVGVMITAGKWYYQENGQHVLSVSGSGGGDYTGAEYSNYATTDDRGEYRIFGLKPGEYYLGTYFFLFRADIRSNVYFPGTFDENAATRLVAAPGAELTGINFRIPSPPDIPTFTISGVVLGSPINKPIESFYLVRHDGKMFRQSLLRNMTGDRSEGRFQLRGVSPGTYDLYPEVRDDQKRLYTARIPVEIRDRNVDNVTIRVQTGVDFRGRFVFEGSFPASPTYGNSFQEFLAKGVAVRLESVDGVPAEFMQREPGPNLPDPKTGEFSIPSLPPGRYIARYQYVIPRGVYFADVRQSGLSVFDDGFTIGSATPDIVDVVFKSPGGLVEGTVRDARQSPVAAAEVVLVPQPSRRQNSALYRTVMTDKDGRFTLRDAAPGNYSIFAWVSVPLNAWRNAEFMAQNETRGMPVRVDAGAPISVQLTALPKVDP